MTQLNDLINKKFNAVIARQKTKDIFTQSRKIQIDTSSIDWTKFDDFSGLDELFGTSASFFAQVYANCVKTAKAELPPTEEMITIPRDMFEELVGYNKMYGCHRLNKKIEEFLKENKK
jgi:hypothetical protein